MAPSPTLHDGSPHATSVATRRFPLRPPPPEPVIELGASPHRGPYVGVACFCCAHNAALATQLTRAPSPHLVLPRRDLPATPLLSAALLWHPVPPSFPGATTTLPSFHPRNNPCLPGRIDFQSKYFLSLATSDGRRGGRCQPPAGGRFCGQPHRVGPPPNWRRCNLRTTAPSCMHACVRMGVCVRVGCMPPSVRARAWPCACARGRERASACGCACACGCGGSGGGGGMCGGRHVRQRAVVVVAVPLRLAVCVCDARR